MALETGEIVDSFDTYLIRIAGKVDHDEINAKSPCAMTLEEAEPSSTMFSVRADQSALIGLMRYLHGMGFRFLSVRITDPES